jgi:Lon protease-like protein
MTDIPLFPIPNCVTFPGSVFPLHVFEPRYRKMIHYCLENNHLLGICHTQKVVKNAKDNQTIEEALQSNQATYKPFEIFSAGECELLNTLEDGRMYLKVHMKARYKTIKELQTLPFSIYACEIYPDESLGIYALNKLGQLKEKILNRLQVMANHNTDVQALLSSPKWMEKDPVDFSFEIFGLLNFGAEGQQKVLEMTSPQMRLQYLLDLLNGVR